MIYSNDIIKKVNDNFVESTISWAKWQKMDSKIEKDFSYTITAIPFPFFNSFMSPNTDNKQRAKEIVETSLQMTRARGLPMVWHLGIDPRPSDFKLLLENKGLLKAAKMPAMIVDIQKLPSYKRQLEIREVTSEKQFREWCQIMQPVHEFPMEFRECWVDIFRAIGFDNSSSWKHFIGYYQGKAVAVSSVFHGSKLVLLANSSVLPEFRKRGFGIEISHHPLKLASEKFNYEIASLWSSDQGKPIYQKMGFKEIGTSDVYLDL